MDSFGGPKWRPGGTAELGKSALGRSKTVLGSTWFGSFFVLSFGFAFLTFLSSSWGRFGPLLALFWASPAPLGIIWGNSWGHFRPPWGRFLVRECSLGVFFYICLSMFACRFSICGLSLSSFTFRFVDASFGFPSGSFR